MARFKNFTPNDKAWAAMLVGPEMQVAVKAEAERAKPIAEALAADFAKSGTYASSFEVSTEIVPFRTRSGISPRVAGKLTNTAPYAAAVEWGNHHDHEPHRVLGKTAAAMSNG